MLSSASLPVQLHNRQLPLGVGAGPRHSGLWVQHRLHIHLIPCDSAVKSQSRV